MGSIRIIGKQLVRICAWGSQGVNVLFFLGHQDQTISARCYENRYKNTAYRWGYYFLNAVFFFQEDHCRSSYNSDIEWAKRICNKRKDE